MMRARHYINLPTNQQPPYSRNDIDRNHTEPGRTGKTRHSPMPFPYTYRTDDGNLELMTEDRWNEVDPSHLATDASESRRNPVQVDITTLIGRKSKAKAAASRDTGHARPPGPPTAGNTRPPQDTGRTQT